ncbi:MAG: hypothetical protein ABI994_01505 [Gemmatimonadales bacterium]
MKVFVITLALAGLASAATVDAQILGTNNRLPTSNRGTNIDGSWRSVGRDSNGNTIYERRTQDSYGNIVVERARRDSNGNLTIISRQNVGNNGNTNNRNGNGRNCDYNRSTNSIGDIIFGRTNDVNCDDNGNRVDGGWYQVGRGRDNNSIYERRTRDRNGNLVIQRARRNSNGTFTIISTRTANNNDRQWRKDQKRQDKEWRKEQKRGDKEHGRSERDDDDDDNRSFSSGDDRFQNSNAVLRGNGHGKGNGKGKHKDD